MLGDCLKKKRLQRLANAEELMSALDDIVSDRRHAVRRSHSHDRVPPSQVELTSKAVTAVALKAQTILSWLVRQVVPLAPQKRKRGLKSTLPWISILVVGWAFLWIVAEIAREAMFPHPVDVDARRTTTQLSPPPRQDESGVAGDSTLGDISAP
jgi:hypothetical protein